MKARIVNACFSLFLSVFFFFRALLNFFGQQVHHSLPPPRSEDARAPMPLQLSRFQTELQDHQDQAAVPYVLSGLKEGFCIGFQPSSVALRSASANMRSAPLNTHLSSMLMETEVSCGRVAGPFSAPPLSGLHVSRFGIIPKSNQPGKWQLILDLSSLEDHNVNSGIPKHPFSAQYVTVDSFIDGIMAQGHGTLVAKFDVASAYRNVAVHPQDCAMAWCNG